MDKKKISRIEKRIKDIEKNKNKYRIIISVGLSLIILIAMIIVVITQNTAGYYWRPISKAILMAAIFYLIATTLLHFSFKFQIYFDKQRIENLKKKK